VVPLYLYGRLLRSDAYQMGIALAKSSPELQKLLGGGIRAAGLPVGSALWRYDSDFAEWFVPLKGSVGSGRLYGVANNIGNQWEFSRLTFRSSKGDTAIDLTPKPSRMSLPRVNHKTVYLVPLNLASEQSLDWAPAYYEAKMGVEVRVLPAAHLDQTEWDSSRHQYVAEKCIDLMVRLHRDLVGDPSAILLGVTSQDMFIDAFDWKYAENLREEGRLGMVSAARLKPSDYPGKWNEELLNSRLQKMLTKNIVVLYFNLALNRDYTSLLSGGVLSGSQVDYMSGEIIGAAGGWYPFFDEGEPMVSIVTAPNKPSSLMMNGRGKLAPDTNLEVFMADLSLGLFVQRKVDFLLDEDYALAFARSYTNGDDRSRSFGIGTTDSLDIALYGQMGSFIDLVLEDGGRIHFVHANASPGEMGDVYRPAPGAEYTDAVYLDGVWTIKSKDGWTYFFPYRPNARDINVTVLTGFVDPKGHKYQMVRDDAGDLLSIMTPSGKWLRFECDEQHRVRRIQDSTGLGKYTKPTKEVTKRTNS
jgi:YD repeat-containing protein